MTLIIPKEIARPDYAADGKPKQRGPLFPWQIEVKSQKDNPNQKANPNPNPNPEP